jgi:molecular chaperone HtpG
MKYEDKGFVNVCADKLDLDTDEEKEALKKENDDAKDMLTKMKAYLGDSVKEVRFTNALKNHVSCLTSEGMLSTEMEKVLNAMPGATGIKAETVLEINASHPVAARLKCIDDEKLKKYTKLLYMQARLIGGLSIEDPAEFCSLVSELMA